MTRLSKSVVLVALLAFAIVASASSIPAGSKVTIRLGSELSSATATTGQTFDGTVADDVVVNGQTVAKRGDPVKGKVTLANQSGRLSKPGQLSLRLTEVNGQAVSSSSVSRKGKSHTKGNAVKIGGGAAAGALIGGLAGGGKGAAIGAGAGAAAGTGVAAYTGKEDVVFPAETALSFTVTGSSSSTARTARKRTTRK